MIIGTAGHIDHGKTALVRALTGVETDRIAAEKERGISIELGYAYLPIPEQERRLGFVDVPGHEALVHTMVAGATGIEFALLVVAANDGIMPQTREHIAILELLGVVKGCVVITKTDTVDQHQMQAVQAQLQSVLKNTFLEQAPVFLMDANQYESEDTSSHLAQLRHYLFQQVGESHKQLNKQPFRLAIDRSFSLTGHGTIVTGTVFSGQLNIAKSAEVPLLHIMPGEHVVRARRIHAQNQPSSQALMGQRCAINIAGMNADDIQRGQWLAQAQCFQPTQRVDVLMNMLNDSQTELRTWSPVHFHLGAAHHHAHCVPLTTPWVQPNDRALVQLVFDEPVCVLPGDRFIVRDAQAQHTIAGGLVLDAQAPDRKRRSKKRLAWLESVNRVIQGEQISHLLQRAPYGLSKTELKRYPTSTAWWKNAAPGGAQWVGQQEAAERILIDTAIYQQIEKKVVQTLAWAHQRYPDDPGVESSRLRRMVAPRIPELLWVALLEGLMKQGEVSLNGAWYHLPSHAVTRSEEHTSELQSRGHLV